ncbi:hypothetical protein E8E11_005059 [Didymella keratinophila]|nr:hypothetical protein E8E11_005059 [Didymella keratinophila]
MATAASGYRTPPHEGLATPPRSSAKGTVDDSQLATPTSVKWESPRPETPVYNVPNPTPRTQKEVDSSPTVKRFQQDLLILTAFNDNSSLHWRPAWFERGGFRGSMWTLHNPPNVVTEPLPNDGKGMQMYTRRTRRRSDPPPQYIKDWDHWIRYCDIYGIPHDFLNEDQVRFMRMGLPRTAHGSICTPPQFPLYPEPSPSP